MPNNLMLNGTDKNDNLSGGKDDILFGSSGNDKLFGGTGNDNLYRDNGNDNLYGDAGAYRLTGSNSNDIFKYLSLDDSLSQSPNVITDFEMGKGKIDIFTFNLT
ncbi:MAG TPA: M10 family metallopeptidase C-terminal domain-containing protein [Arsenophonus sp.]